ncbi:MAG TPA: ribose-5-phosphate isomerase RpiA [Acetobacteraceae bacterium]|nr:ribose-5-phosphate isomerase RpiA [Acetobacteraceae bacterium]
MTEATETDPKAARKREAGEAAAAMVQDGMAVGLGTGSTAYFAVAALGRRVRAGLRIAAIPTSERTAAQARAEGIPLVTFAERSRLDLTIDGADEIARGSLDLIKGLGGALLREKLVAAASDRLMIVADDSKLVDRLGTHAPVPVEVVAFGWETTAARLAAAGVEPALRRGTGGAPFVTDGGNLILDCACRAIADPAALHRRLKEIVGVVETGLFPAMVSAALVAGAGGVMRLERG